MTRETFDCGMAMMLAVYRDLKVTPAAINSWFVLLRDLGEEDFLWAVETICRTEKQIYPGTNIVALIREKAQGDPSSLALRAVFRLEKAMQEVGAYRSPDFSDPVMHHAIVRMGGWEAVCLMDLEDWKFARKDFERIYADLVRNGIPEEVPRLIGTIERETGSQEYPALINGSAMKQLKGGRT